MSLEVWAGQDSKKCGVQKCQYREANNMLNFNVCDDHGRSGRAGRNG